MSKVLSGAIFIFERFEINLASSDAGDGFFEFDRLDAHFPLRHDELNLFDLAQSPKLVKLHLRDAVNGLSLHGSW